MPMQSMCSADPRRRSRSHGCKIEGARETPSQPCAGERRRTNVPQKRQETRIPLSEEAPDGLGAMPRVLAPSCKFNLMAYTNSSREAFKSAVYFFPGANTTLQPFPYSVDTCAPVSCLCLSVYNFRSIAFMELTWQRLAGSSCAGRLVGVRIPWTDCFFRPLTRD